MPLQADSVQARIDASIGPGGIEIWRWRRRTPTPCWLQSDQEELKFTLEDVVRGPKEGFNRTRRN